jgi:tetratricopeptide (TPR) repeat protein
VLSPALVIMGQSSAPSNDAALGLLQKGDYAGALALADQALRQDSHDCRMLTIRSLALKNSGEVADASHAFTTAASFCPTFVPALEGLAELQYAQRSPLAAGTLEKILALQPGNQTSHAMLAVIEGRAGDCAGAVEHFAKAADLIRSSSAAMTQYGFCLLATDEPEQARNTFHQLLDTEDTSGNRLRYAYACWKAKDYSEGLRALSPLLKGSSPDPEGLALAARLAESGGDTPRAVDLLQKAIAARPADPRNYLIFSEVSFNHASYKVGIDMLNAGIARLPEEALLYVARGVLEVQQSKFEDALADFRRAHQLDPNLSLAGDAIGIMLDQRHQTAESLAAYAAQAKAHPEDALVQYLYAEALSQSDPATQKHNEVSAIEVARRAVSLEPDYQPALDLLSQLEVRAGNLDNALEVAKKAVALNPEDETAIYQELMAYRRLGKKAEVNQLVARLKQVKEHQQSTKTNYQLQEVTKPD